MTVLAPPVTDVRPGPVRYRPVRPVRTGLVALVAVLLCIALGRSPAHADTGDFGYEGPSYSGAGDAPTADKPQSKLWWNDGFWWADMFDTGSGTWHIFRLNRSANTWVDTGTQIDSRASTRGDALWDGTHLYVAHQVLAASSSANVTGQPARLFRYSYAAGTDTYTLDAGFPVAINNVSSESLTLDKDSTGVLWATWTQGQKVYVNSTTGGDSTWGTPFTLGVTGSSSMSADDISSLAAYGGHSVGLMWSNQNTSTFYFASHTDGAGRTAWTSQAAVANPAIADDHLNLKQLTGDGAGHLYAAVKTGLEINGPSATSTALLALDTSDGTWDLIPFGTAADCHTRPMLVIDPTNQVLHMFATAPTASGCPHTGDPGTIYEKTTPLADLSFPAGRGTPVIRDASSAGMNNATGTKQNVTADTGIVLLASNDLTRRYWHADIPIAGGNPTPTVSFAATPTSGTAPLQVAFTDTSTGGVTGWAWTFGDGGTSTLQNPTHTYATAGTYTATLTGTTAGGASSSSSRTITVTATTGQVAYGGSTSTGLATTTTSLTLTAPAGTGAGDLLVASLSVDNAPTVTAPAGWTSLAALQPSGVTVRGYYRVITAADAGTTSWTWRLSAAQKWSGGLTRYTGVNTTTPLGSAVTTATSATGSITVPAVTSTTAGAMVIGSVGTDSASAVVTPPAGWTKAWETAVGQAASASYRATTATGGQGSTTWRLSKAVAAGAWTVVLRPA